MGVAPLLDRRPNAVRESKKLDEALCKKNGRLCLDTGAFSNQIGAKLQSMDSLMELQ